MQKPNSFLVQALHTALTLFFSGLLILALFRPDIIESAIRTIGEISNRLGHWNLLIITLSSFIESFPVIGVLVPWQQILLVVGGFYGQAHFVLAVLGACIGAIFGNWIGYWIWVRHGESFLASYGELFALGKTERRILSKRIEKNGASFIIFGKFHNFTRAFVPFLAGVSQMHSSRFWKYNIIGSVIWSMTMLVLGVFFTRYIETVLDWISWIFLWIIVLVGIYIALFKRKEFAEYLREKEIELQK